jgi:hypothetical protein
VAAVKANVVVLGLSLPIFEREKTQIKEWTSRIASRQLDFMLTNNAVRGKVDELTNDFTVCTHNMLDYFTDPEKAAGPTLKEKEHAVHNFFTMLHVVMDLHACTTEAPRGKYYVSGCSCVFFLGFTFDGRGTRPEKECQRGRPPP